MLGTKSFEVVVLWVGLHLTMLCSDMTWFMFFSRDDQFSAILDSPMLEVDLDLAMLLGIIEV